MNLFPDSFYDRTAKIWICRVVDKDGNQVGDCDYEPRKDLAEQTAKNMVEDMLEELSKEAS